MVMDDDVGEVLDEDDVVTAPRVGQAFVGLCVSVREQPRLACRRARSLRRRRFLWKRRGSMPPALHVATSAL